MDHTDASAIDAVPPRRTGGTDATELLAVIAIIAMLAASALRYYEQALVKSAVSEALMATALLRRKAFEHHDRTGRWPSGRDLFVSSKPFMNSNSGFGNYISAVEFDAEGAMTVTYSARIPALSGHRLTLRPVVIPGSDGSVRRWTCGHRLPPSPAIALGIDRTDLPEPYLLHLCRQGALP